jgi:HEAT repeat protein/energy-coupling factor transporter ATP-binding protein EcfA2
MAAEIDFQPYLHSISTHYDQWCRFYTETDAETQAKQKDEPQPWATPFDFGLMVQTVQRDRPITSEALGLEPQSPREKIERFPVLEGIRKFVKEHRQVLLVGRPGSGKSTTLARLLLEEARNVEDPPNPLKKGELEVNNYSSDGELNLKVPLKKGDLGGSRGIGDLTNLIPVLVELRFWSGSILDRIQAFFQRHDLLLDRTQIEDLLFHRRLLLLMDGLNELPSEAARLDVAKFRQDFPKVSMIFTTRDLSLEGDFGLEKKLEMQPLTEAQMQAFVRSYVPEQAEAMLRQLKDRLREFGQTPLLLWMFCGLFRQTGQIPANLGEVFRAFTQGYERNLKADVPVESDQRWWPELLQELAFWMMRGVSFGEEAPAVDVEFRAAIAKAEARQIFTAFLQNKETQSEGAAKKYLDDLLRHHLIQLDGEQVEFRHQLLQEYYAAEYLLGHWEQLSELEFKRDYLNYLKWTEAIALMIGLAANNRLVLQLVDSALEIDWSLGARLAGKVKIELQPVAVGRVSELEIPGWLKVELLEETRSDSAIPGLLNILKHENSDVCNKAAVALGQLFPEQQVIFTEKVLSSLLNSLNHEDFHMRWKATDALEKLISEQTIPTLLDGLLEHTRFDGLHFNLFKKTCNALEKIGAKQAIPRLLKALNNGGCLMCLNAVELLGQLGSEEAIPGLLNALKDEEWFMRERAVTALGQLKSEEVIPELLNTLKDENYYVRESAAIALGQLGSEEAIPELLNTLKCEDSRVSKRAIDALEMIGLDKVIPGLLDTLEHENSEVRERAVDSLGMIGSEQAIPKLLEVLDDKDFFVRWRAASALGKIDPEQIIPRLLKALTNKQFYIRERAVDILVEIGSEQTIPGLLEALNDENSGVRWKAAAVLGQLGLEQAIPELLCVLKHDDYAVRERAAGILGQLGSEQAVPGLLNELKHEDFFMRRNVVGALTKISSAEAIPGLLSALKDVDYSVRANAAAALGQLASEETIPELLNALNDEDYYVRESAAAALGEINSEQAIPGLLKMIQYSSSENLVDALGKICSEQAIPELLYALEHHCYSQSMKAADALGKIGSEQAIPGLLKALLNHESLSVSVSAANALGELGSEQAIPGLLKALEHQNHYVRDKVAYVLCNIYNIALPQKLPQLMTLLRTSAGEQAFKVMSTIQSNCKFYNYDITQSTQSMKLFFSYAHKDEALRDQLAPHLSLLKHQNIITDWHDRNITAGTDWAQAIDNNLNTADIILLLISADFLASDYCYDKEMTRALERHNQNTARVIPIILRPCDWHSAPFGKLQALPIAHGGGAKPVTQWSDQDEAFTNIAQGIRKAVAELQQRKSSPATSQPKTASPQPANVTMNFYGTVHGAAGTVQGDQNIQPTE